MMRILAGCIVAILFVAAGPVYAQVDPCAQDFKRTVTKDIASRVNLSSMLTNCDSLIILSDSAYNFMIFEREFNKELNGRLEGIVDELEDGRKLRDSLIAEQKNFIAFQQSVITRYDSLLVESNTLVRRATANTDKALNRLSLLKWTSIGGIAIGVGGILVAAIAN